MIYVTINSPKQVKSKMVENIVKKAMKQGAKKNDLHLLCSFVAPDSVFEQINTDWRQLKIKVNKIVNPPDLSTL